LARRGLRRARIDGEVHGAWASRRSWRPPLRGPQPSKVIVDGVVKEGEGIERRLTDSFDDALRGWPRGVAAGSLCRARRDEAGGRHDVSAAPRTARSAAELRRSGSRGRFSFTPRTARCPALPPASGNRYEVEPEARHPAPRDLSIDGGAVAPWGRQTAASFTSPGYLGRVADKDGFKTNVAVEEVKKGRPGRCCSTAREPKQGTVQYPQPGTAAPARYYTHFTRGAWSRTCKRRHSGRTSRGLHARSRFEGAQREVAVPECGGRLSFVKPSPNWAVDGPEGPATSGRAVQPLEKSGG